jgi:hypothetical protein
MTRMMRMMKMIKNKFYIGLILAVLIGCSMVSAMSVDMKQSREQFYRHTWVIERHNTWIDEYMSVQGCHSLAYVILDGRIYYGSNAPEDMIRWCSRGKTYI